jgi:hypothetical protein
MLKRLDTLEIATADVSDAASTYAGNFGFKVSKSEDGKTAIVKVGDAEIRLVSSASQGVTVEASAEGMVALWFESDDVEKVASDLREAGIETAPIRQENDRRVLALDPKVANQVPLFIFDRVAK